MIYESFYILALSYLGATLCIIKSINDLLFMIIFMKNLDPGSS